MPFDSSFLIAFSAALLLGISKAGLKGMGIVVVTLMAIVYGAKASTGIVLPLLIFADIIAVVYYRRHANWALLMKFLPWMVFGVLVGVFVGNDLPEAIFKTGMAVIILVSVVIMYAWEYFNKGSVPQNKWFAAVIGSIAGFTTMVGNLAGAFTNIYFLAMRVSKNEFIGTAAWLFFIINLFKLPFHVFNWKTISVETLKIDLLLFPAVFIGFVLGLFLVKKFKEEQYRKFILFMTAVGAIVILFK